MLGNCTETLGAESLKILTPSGQFILNFYCFNNVYRNHSLELTVKKHKWNQTHNDRQNIRTFDKSYNTKNKAKQSTVGWLMKSM